MTAQPGNGPHVRQQRKDQQTVVRSRLGLQRPRNGHAPLGRDAEPEDQTLRSAHDGILSFFLFSDARNQAKPISLFLESGQSLRGQRPGGADHVLLPGLKICQAALFVTYALIYIHLSIMWL